jgi:hypothetical protein
MGQSAQVISTHHDHILIERAPGYEVAIDEQPEALMELSAACEKAGCKKVLLVGPRTRVGLSAFDILDLGKEIARIGVQMAIVEIHDASDDAVSLLESAASNRGGAIQFFDNTRDAKQWLEIE